MREKMIKRAAALLTVLALLLAVLLPAGTALAAGSSVSVSGKNAEVGQDVAVTVTVKSDVALGSITANIHYDPSILTFVPAGANDNVQGRDGELIWSWFEATNTNTSVSRTIYFKAVGAGSATVTVNLTDVSDVETNPIDLSSGSGVVTVTAPTEAEPTDVTLKSLKVSPGELKPAFSPDVKNYTLDVPATQERIVVDAVAADPENTRVQVAGVSKIEPGENKVTITVTAKNGSGSTKYTITVTRPEAPATQPSTEKPTEAKTTEAESPTEPTETESESETETETESESETVPVVPHVTYNGTDLFPVKSLEGIELPEGFEESAAAVMDAQVPAGRSITGGLVLLPLTTEEDGKDPAFYLYDEQTGAVTPFIRVSVGPQMYTILPFPAETGLTARYVPAEGEIGGARVEGFKPDAQTSEDYLVVYAMNWEGEAGLYRFDAHENTMQRLDPESLLQEDQTEEIVKSRLAAMEQQMQVEREQAARRQRFFFWGLIGLGILSLALLLGLIFSLIRRRGDDDEDELLPEEKKETPVPAAAPAEAVKAEAPAMQAPAEEKPAEEMPEAAEEEIPVPVPVPVIPEEEGEPNEDTFGEGPEEGPADAERGPETAGEAQGEAAPEGDGAGGAEAGEKTAEGLGEAGEEGAEVKAPAPEAEPEALEADQKNPGPVVSEEVLFDTLDLSGVTAVVSGEEAADKTAQAVKEAESTAERVVEETADDFEFFDL